MSAGKVALKKRASKGGDRWDIHDSTPNQLGYKLPERWRQHVLADTIARFGPDNEIAMMLGLIHTVKKEVTF